MDIKEALLGMDSLDDDMWTGDGMPKIEAVKAILGRSVSRKEIIDAHPGFTRESLDEPANVPPVASVPLIANVPPVATPIDEVDPIDALKIERQDLEDDVTIMKAHVAEAENEIAAKRAAIDKLNDELTVLDPPLSNAERVRNFINAANESRINRHYAQKAVIANLPKEAYTVGTPLDQAYARRNKRGGGRPTR